MKHKDAKIIREIVEGEGYELVSIDEGGKHPKVYITDGQVTRMCIAGNSPSDYRARKNFAGDIRRMFRSETT